MASEFFRGEQTVDEFVITFHSGRARLSCTIVECWKELISRPLVCGQEYEREFIQRNGITSIDREEIEATISGSLGLKGIAEFKSQIKGKTGRELQFEQSQEIRETTKFTAPKCGRLTLLIYQLKRLYQFCYQDTRFLHHDSWTKTIPEWTNRIHEASKASQNDPACGCDPRAEAGIDGQLYLDMGKISMVAGYRNHASALEIPSLDLSIAANENEPFTGTVSINRKAIPAHLCFLADEQSDNVTARLLPYVEEWSANVIEVQPSLRAGIRGLTSLGILSQQRKLADELRRRLIEAESGQTQARS